MTACPSEETGKSSVAPWSSPMKSACGVVTGTIGKQKAPLRRPNERSNEKAGTPRATPRPDGRERGGDQGWGATSDRSLIRCNRPHHRHIPGEPRSGPPGRNGTGPGEPARPAGIDAVLTVSL